MILDARQTPAQRRFNEPKIAEIVSRNSEPWADEDHHVEEVLKCGPCSIYYTYGGILVKTRNASSSPADSEFLRQSTGNKNLENEEI